MDSDFLYHLGIYIANTKDTSDIETKFGDVKFVCMGGTKERMRELALHLHKVLDMDDGDDVSLVDLCETAHRFAVFKVGPVLCCSHGIGMSSMSVLLHEVIKLMKYSKCKNPMYMRVGTCGGLGVQPGTVVVTRNAYNGYLRNEHEIAILGRRVVRPAKFDETVLRDLSKCSESTDDFDTIIANTLSTDCFYEGQGRLDGAVCDYDEQAKLGFLQRCYEQGIRNIEMEATMFASLTLHVGVRAADVCVTIVNRLVGDQVTITTAQKKDFEKRPLIIAGRYIKLVLSQLNAMP